MKNYKYNSIAINRKYNTATTKEKISYLPNMYKKNIEYVVIEYVVAGVTKQIKLKN